jgi:hypothetical protein
MKKVYILITISLLLNSTNSQDTSIVNYMPMSVGNVWVYHASAFGDKPLCYCSKYTRTKITGTVIKNGKTYYLFQNTDIFINCGPHNCFGPSFDTNRVDPVSGNIIKYSSTGCSYSPNEIMIDSLRARLHDTIHINCSTYTQYSCYDTNSVVLFGVSRRAKYFYADEFEGGWSNGYVRGIGLASMGRYALWCMCNTNILGCVINGVVYGDTTFTLLGLDPISATIPEEFSLSQNYPNPFNPSTKIKFDIPLLRGVDAEGGRGVSARLTIYDLLGREITKLVNQPFQPGTYEVEWDGTNYPSGVYFYKLIAGNYSDTKKLVLLK